MRTEHFRPLVLLAAALMTGCGGGATVPTISVSGTVTLDGAPLKTGFIIFHPDIEGAAPVGRPIENGRFEVPMLPPGQYKVAVKSNTLDAPAGPVSSDFNAPTAQAKPDPIPWKYREPTIPVDCTKATDSIKVELSSQ